MASWNVSPEAAALHENSLVWDNHICLPHETDDKWMLALSRHRQAGANMVVLSIAGSDMESLETTIKMATFYRDWVRQNADTHILALSPEDILMAKSQNKLAVAFNVEAPKAVGENLSLVQLYHELGVRWMIMAYNMNNQIGGGCHDEDPGLTKFGFKFIEEMDRAGIVKCCSHTGYRTAMDVMTHTDKPVIFSHSNARALRDHPRNIPDELIAACAKTGGTVGINGVGIFLGDNDITTTTFVNHIDHIVQKVGADHVAIGTDYVYDEEEFDASMAAMDNIWPANFGYEPGIKFLPPEQLPQITEELLRRNYKEVDIKKILGENLLRVATQTW